MPTLLDSLALPNGTTLDIDPTIINDGAVQPLADLPEGIDGKTLLLGMILFAKGPDKAFRKTHIPPLATYFGFENIAAPRVAELNRLLAEAVLQAFCKRAPAHVRPAFVLRHPPPALEPPAADAAEVPLGDRPAPGVHPFSMPEHVPDAARELLQRLWAAFHLAERAAGVAAADAAEAALDDDASPDAVRAARLPHLVQPAWQAGARRIAADFHVDRAARLSDEQAAQAVYGLCGELVGGVEFHSVPRDNTAIALTAAGLSATLTPAGPREEPSRTSLRGFWGSLNALGALPGGAAATAGFTPGALWSDREWRIGLAKAAVSALKKAGRVPHALCARLQATLDSDLPMQEEDAAAWAADALENMHRLRLGDWCRLASAHVDFLPGASAQTGDRLRRSLATLAGRLVRVAAPAAAPTPAPAAQAPATRPPAEAKAPEGAHTPAVAEQLAPTLQAVAQVTAHSWLKRTLTRDEEATAQLVAGMHDMGAIELCSAMLAAGGGRRNQFPHEVRDYAKAPLKAMREWRRLDKLLAEAASGTGLPACFATDAERRAYQDRHPPPAVAALYRARISLGRFLETEYPARETADGYAFNWPARHSGAHRQLLREVRKVREREILLDCAGDRAAQKKFVDARTKATDNLRHQEGSLTYQKYLDHEAEAQRAAIKILRPLRAKRGGLPDHARHGLDILGQPEPSAGRDEHERKRPRKEDEDEHRRHARRKRLRKMTLEQALADGSFTVPKHIRDAQDGKERQTAFREWRGRVAGGTPKPARRGKRRRR
jgi:hypothetical protein